MEKEKRACTNCAEGMQYVPCTPTYVCVYCGRMETESGIVINPGQDLRDRDEITTPQFEIW